MRCAPILLACLLLVLPGTAALSAVPVHTTLPLVSFAALATEPEPHEEHAAGEHHGDNSRAEALAVSEMPPWYGTVVTGFLVLFLLAVFVGSAAIIVRGPEPPDPADDHGHDDNHGHDHHH